jgi:DNA-binding NtrC family response regulator
MPPLRERKGDIPFLAEYFLARFSRELGAPNYGISKEVLAMLQAHSWPGNVRELANTLHKALIFSRGYPLREQDLAQAVAGAGPESMGEEKDVAAAVRAWVRSALRSGPTENLFNSLLDHLAGIIISEAITITAGNRSRAAKLLGLSRPTLQAKIEKFKFKIGAAVKEEET